MATNNFLPFCSTDTGTNLLTDSAYAAATGRISGNVPGVASSALVNKALRQANFITSQLAQLVSNQTNTNVNDDANTAAFLAQLSGLILPHLPTISVYTGSSGTHTCTFKFLLASANATTGATYTHNGVTYTVTQTITAGNVLTAKGNGIPLSSGTLTKATGTGDAAITFYAVRNPFYMRVRMAGGGGGGGGSGTASNGVGSGGANSTFGTSFLTAGAGSGGQSASGGNGAGGTPTFGGGVLGVTALGQGWAGGDGTSMASTAISGLFLNGAVGGCNPLGGAGHGAQGGGGNGGGGAANTGAGGGGGCSTSSTPQFWTGGGGGAGAYIDVIVPSPLASYGYVVGAGGNGGTLGSSGFAGGNGAAGIIIVEEFYP